MLQLLGKQIFRRRPRSSVGAPILALAGDRLSGGAPQSSPQNGQLMLAATIERLLMVRGEGFRANGSGDRWNARASLVETTPGVYVSQKTSRGLLPPPQAPARSVLQSTTPFRRDWIPHRTRTFVCSLEERGSNVAGVQVAGELRAATAPELACTLRRAERQARLIGLDGRQVTFIDPCGVHVVLAAGLRARREGRRLAVVRAPAPTDPAVALSAASDVVDIVDLTPGQPAVQALLELAQRDRAA
jgi:anti-anti-sigma regulatory factor